jgi:two-component system, NarL family, invasion response regulator UvrY
MSQPHETQVAIVDDHTLVRKGLIELVNGLEGYQVVLEAGNGAEYQQAVNGGPRIDLAIVDLNMPVIDGYETIRWINAQCPETKPLALTFEANEDNVIKAVRNGARGFVLKDIEPAGLKSALDNIRDTGYYHTDLLHQSLMHNFDKKTSAEREHDKVLERVTAREMEFLKLVCDPREFTYEEIADLMSVGSRTAHGYRNSLAQKFGLKSKTGLVLFAVKWGIVKV